MWTELIENEISRGIIFGFLGAVLSIPARLVLRFLRKLPQDILPTDKLPLLMAGIGLLLGAALGHFSVVDTSHGIQVGIQAGAMSGIGSK